MPKQSNNKITRSQQYDAKKEDFENRINIYQVACEHHDQTLFDIAKHKVNVNFQDEVGKTPLMYAVINKFIYGIHKLIYHKEVDFYLKDHAGNTAFDYTTIDLELPLEYLVKLSGNCEN